MADGVKKKGRQVSLFFLVFAVILIVMFVASGRSRLVEELAAPSKGVISLHSYGRELIAVSKDSEIHSWRWDDLRAPRRICTLNGDEVVVMANNRVLLAGSGEAEAIVVSDLSSGKELRRMRFGSGKRLQQLRSSVGGQCAVAAFSCGDSATSGFELWFIDSELESIVQVGEEIAEEGFELKDVGIGDDGSFIAAVGVKDGGWILGVDRKSGLVTWRGGVEDSASLSVVMFSPEGAVIYASGLGRYVYAVDAANGEIVRRFEMDEYATPELDPQRVSCMAVSSDGKLLAAATEPASKLYAWEVASGSRVVVTGTGQYTISGIAFSPDGSLAATADYISMRAIKVWKVRRGR